MLNFKYIFQKNSINGLKNDRLASSEADGPRPQWDAASQLGDPVAAALDELQLRHLDLDLQNARLRVELA